MPDNLYFRQPSTQALLLDILFIFSKLNPDVGYRQGMHELLAPVVWVVERDALDDRNWKRTDMEDTGHDKLLFEVLDHRFIEHDAFTIFCLMMQNAKTFYEPGSDGFKGPPTSQSSATGEAPMLTRIDRIFNKLLPKFDPELSSHLNKLEVVPQVFLLYDLIYQTNKPIANQISGAGCDCCSAVSFHSMIPLTFGTTFMHSTLHWHWWTLSALRCFFVSDGNVSVQTPYFQYVY